MFRNCAPLFCPSLGQAFAALALASVLSVASAPVASAQASQHDGLYRRLDHDFVLSFALGGNTRTNAFSVNPDSELRVRYWDTLGVFLAGEWLEGDALRDTVFMSAGIDLRPLFAFRFFRNHFSENEWLDRALDSIGLDLGARWPVANSHNTDGLAFLFGVGIELPLWPLDLFFLRLATRVVFANVTEGTIGLSLGMRFAFGNLSHGWPFN